MADESSEEETFIKAIRASPGDDDSRLVYADWLEERGTPDTSLRAEYLRLEVALANAGYSILPSEQSEEVAQRRRFEDIGHVIDSDWRTSMLRTASRFRVAISKPRVPPARAATPIPQTVISNEPVADLSANRFRSAPSLPPPSSSSSPGGGRRLSWPVVILLGVLLAVGAITTCNQWKKWWRGEGPPPSGLTN